MKKNVADLVVRNADGSIDESASRDKFLEALRAHEVNAEANRAKASVAVEALFDTYKGRVLNKPMVISAALGALGATPENHAELSEAIESYIDISPAYASKKGRGGGIRRLADGGWAGKSSVTEGDAKSVADSTEA